MKVGLRQRRDEGQRPRRTRGDLDPELLVWTSGPHEDQPVVPVLWLARGGLRLSTVKNTADSGNYLLRAEGGGLY